MRTYRSIRLKVFTTDCKHSQSFVLEPPLGKLWTSDALLPEISRFVFKLKEAFPNNEFQVVRKGSGRYNIVPLNLVPEEAACSAEENQCQQVQ